MPIRSLIVAAMNRFFRLRGMELRGCETPNSDNSMEAALARARRLAPDIAGVIDVGAAAGLWTRRSLVHFSNARHLLIEPLVEREAALAALRAEKPDVEFTIAAAGAAEGEAVLDVAGDLDSSGIYGGSSPNQRKVRVTTLDREVERRGLRGPLFIKLDTHGFEAAILDGARDCLAHTALLMIEAYNFAICPGCLRFHELCARLEASGFLPCDIAEPMRRSRDDVLWQMDLVFARRDHPAITHTSYR